MELPRISTFGIIGKFLIAMAAVVVIQGVLAFRFEVISYFDLPLICSVYYGFVLGNPIASILIGSGLGLMQDGLSGSLLGSNGLSKTLIGFLAASAGSKFNVDQAITRGAALFLFSIGDGLLVSILGLTTGSVSTPGYGAVLGGWTLSAAFNTLLGLALFGYYDRLGNATS